MLLALKFVLAPTLVAIVTLVGRALGPRVAGFLAALPIVAGPIVWLMTAENGPAFGSRAALACALGSSATTAFAWGFVRAAPTKPWFLAVALGYVGFALVSGLLGTFPASPWLYCTVPFIVHLTFLRRVPAVELTHRPPPAPRWDVPMRMLLTAALVLTVTGLARSLGAHWTGLITPFPVATSVLASFAHVQQGPRAATQLLRGLVLGLNTFVLFFVVLGLSLTRLSTAHAFMLSSAVGLAAHTLLALRRGS